MATLFNKSPYALQYLDYRGLTYTIFGNGTVQGLGSLIFNVDSGVQYAHSYAILQDGNIEIYSIINKYGSAGASVTFSNNNGSLFSLNLGIYNTINFSISYKIGSSAKANCSISSFGQTMFTGQNHSNSEVFYDQEISNNLSQLGALGDSFNIQLVCDTYGSTSSSQYTATMVVKKIWLSIS